MDYEKIKDDASLLSKSAKRIIVAVTVVVFWSVMILGTFLLFVDEDTMDHVAGFSSDSETEETVESDTCNTYGLNIVGGVVTYYSKDVVDIDGDLMANQTSADEIKYYIDQANEDENIQAIILEINSGGGSAVGGEEMMTAIKNSKKPVVAYIRDIGASAAYLAATGAQRIFASRFSDVGSIGVTYSYLDYSEKNRREGIKYVELSSGKFKDTGDPDKALTPEELALYRRDIEITKDYFIQMVAENRNLTIAEVSKLADGSTLMAKGALEAGLIDEIGSFNEVEAWIKDKIGAEVDVCWKN